MQEVKNVQEDTEVFWQRMSVMTSNCDKQMWNVPILHVVIGNGHARASVMLGDCDVFANSEVWAFKSDVNATNQWKVTRMLHERVGVWGLGNEYASMCTQAMTDANMMRRTCALAIMHHRSDTATGGGVDKLARVHELHTQQSPGGSCTVLFPEYGKLTATKRHIPVQICADASCGWWSVTCVDEEMVAFPIPQVGGKHATKRCVSEDEVANVYGSKLLTVLKGKKRKMTIVKKI